MANLVELAYLTCLLAAILVTLMLYAAYRKQKKTIAAQRMIDRQDRGETLFMGNPRSKARQSPEEWEAHQRKIQKYPRRRFRKMLTIIPWKRKKGDSSSLGPEPWEWK